MQVRLVCTQPFNLSVYQFINLSIYQFIRGNKSHWLGPLGPCANYWSMWFMDAQYSALTLYFCAYSFGANWCGLLVLCRGAPVWSTILVKWQVFRRQFGWLWHAHVHIPDYSLVPKFKLMWHNERYGDNQLDFRSLLIPVGDFSFNFFCLLFPWYLFIYYNSLFEL